jgi:diguanylate cyclase (GGDEF)-like protein
MLRFVGAQGLLGNPSDEDVGSFGSKFVGWFTRTFMALRHRDELHQIALLNESRDVEWVGIRTLQMRKGHPVLIEESAPTDQGAVAPRESRSRDGQETKSPAISRQTEFEVIEGAFRKADRGAERMASEHWDPTRLRERIAAWLQSPWQWRDGYKCVFASGLTLPFVLAWIIRLTLVHANPARGPYMEPGNVGPMLVFVWIQAAGHIAVIAAGLLFQRRERMPWLVHFAVQFWFVCFALTLYAIGPYTSAFAMLLLIFPLLGFIVFGIRRVAYGLATFAALLVATTVAERLDVIPYAPLFVSATLVDGRPYTSWIVSLGWIPLLGSGWILVVFAYVVRQWRDREERLKELSDTDYLTNVRNRRSFMESAEIEFYRARRYGKSLAVVMIDVDHFKRVNDDHGHGIGDQILQLVAKILAAEVRRHDVIARYGGEEFAFLLTETNREQARVMAERCRERIEAAQLVVKRSVVRVTASAGIAAYPREGVSRIEQLIDLADGALYRAKESGRNRVSIAA